MERHKHCYNEYCFGRYADGFTYASIFSAAVLILGLSFISACSNPVDSGEAASAAARSAVPVTSDPIDPKER
jgi:hypothetical protein